MFVAPVIVRSSKYPKRYRDSDHRRHSGARTNACRLERIRRDRPLAFSRALRKRGEIDARYVEGLFCASGMVCRPGPQPRSSTWRGWLPLKASTWSMSSAARRNASSENITS